MANVDVKNLSFLDWQGLDLSVGAGEIIAIYGQSGSGKSLFLRAIADLIPWEGTISLRDQNCLETEPPEWRRKVAYIPTEILWWHDTVSEHFENEVSDDSLSKLGLTAEALGWAPNRLSMGERQRLGLLRALDRNPEVLLLDEPTANLDSGTTLAVEELVCQYLSNRSACAIWVSHDESQLGRVATKTFRMEGKKLEEVMG